ncbi:MAG: dihydrofolate reductase, partial [Hyphomicrobiales bacterium]
MGKPIIMGRKTYQSIGKPLGGRDNIVISRDDGFAEAGIHVAGDLAGALKIGEKFAHARSARQILVIGGAQIYQLALPFATRIYLTQVHMDARGDVSMAPFAPSEWIEAERRDCAAEPGDSADYSLVTMVRTNRPARDISIAKTLDRPG